MREAAGIVKHVLILLLKAYRLVISPLYGDVCRYWPTCSAYALRAVEHRGALRGTWLTARRLLRCHPWARGGYDPVPGTPEHAEWLAEQAATASDDGTAATQPDCTHPDCTHPDGHHAAGSDTDRTPGGPQTAATPR